MLAAALLLLLAAADLRAQALPQRPAAGEWVRDTAQLLSPRETSKLRQRCAAVQERLGVPVLVLTVKRLGDHGAAGVTAAGLSRRMLEEWSVEHPLLAGPPWARGVLVLVAVEDRQARVSFGPGWDGEHDVAAHRIGVDRLLPALRAGQYAAGLTAAVVAAEAVAEQRPIPPLPTSRATVAGWTLFAVVIAATLSSLLRRGRRGWAARAWLLLLALPATLLDRLTPDPAGFESGRWTVSRRGIEASAEALPAR